MPTSFHDRLRQLSLLAIILLLIFLLFHSLSVFLPGILGAVTLYILSRKRYFHLIMIEKWRKGWTAGLFLLFYLIILGVPIYIVIALLQPKVHEFLTNPQQYVDMFKNAVETIEKRYNYDVMGPNTLNAIFEKISTIVPRLLNSTTNILFNLAIMLFLLYYLLINGQEIEKYSRKITPLKARNIDLLVTETQNNIKANAIGIPLISIIQGMTAMLGYYIFGVPEFAIWGVLTGLFAFFPMVGTMIIWVPVVVFMYASGETWPATGVLLYSLLVTGNVDTLARMTLLKRIGNVHPVVTILGVISGLSLFGFIGLIFGPLLINYIIVLFQIYLNEFVPGFEDEDVTDKVSH
ncbi:AI-2E family transporter [Flavihumibacter petaseus]|uniref:AI-2E family transporter n=1 Tax=Flavihumibacter petaseus NBRC 106054 TaxID=1220578 RepID=A0A0E9N7E1_9BACT|nr:AI-2E family transporter [Flavihumibacter petaseus]GAO45621.1 hypothetical protein FPE01S_07_00090 [Flavihumibacter petaseus NBRC 106054]